MSCPGQSSVHFRVTHISFIIRHLLRPKSFSHYSTLAPHMCANCQAHCDWDTCSSMSRKYACVSPPPLSFPMPFVCCEITSVLLQLQLQSVIVASCLPASGLLALVSDLLGRLYAILRFFSLQLPVCCSLSSSLLPLPSCLATFVRQPVRPQRQLIW